MNCPVCQRPHYTVHSLRIHMAKAHPGAEIPAWAKRKGKR